MFKKFECPISKNNVEKHGIGDTFIKIKYKNSNQIYVHTYINLGRDIVESLKNAAIKGESGLFIYLSLNKIRCEYVEDIKAEKLYY